MKYTVELGDNLWNISKKTLGKGSAWRKIYSYNYDIIGDNCDLIHPGQVLKIPKYISYRKCLKVECEQLADKISKGQTEYKNRLFKCQDELMRETVIFWASINACAFILYRILY